MIKENSKYKGIGGWLLLFCIVLTIITPILSASQIVSGYVNTPITNSTVKAALIIESGIAGLLHFYGFVTGCIVWSGNKNGIIYAKRFLIINLIGFFAIATSVALLFDAPEARHKVIGSYILLVPKGIAFFLRFGGFILNIQNELSSYMKIISNIKKFVFIVCVFHSIQPLKSSEPIAVAEFKKIDLPYGICVEIPKHWTIIDQASRSNLEAAGSSVAKNSGLDLNNKRQNLLAVNSVPSPTGAMIRVSVSPPEFTQEELSQLTPEDLKNLGPVIENMFKQAEKAGGPKVVKFYPLKIEKFNNLYSMVLNYDREEITSNSIWNVTQYKIPQSNKLIEITLSKRQSDSPIWRPILERVKNSVSFGNN